MSSSSELPGRIVATCAELGLMVGCAESLTGGRLCASLVDVPGASRVVRGGVVAYQLPVKSALLGVDAQFLADCGPYNYRTASDMARGARAALGCDIGVATTGVAGPGADDDVPAGSFWVAVDGPSGTLTASALSAGDRSAVRQAAVDAGLTLLWDYLTSATHQRG